MNFIFEIKQFFINQISILDIKSPIFNYNSFIEKIHEDDKLRLKENFDKAIKAYEMFRKAEEKRYTSGKPTETDIAIDWTIPKGFKRTIFTDKAAARKEFGATYTKELMKHDRRIVVLHADLAASGGFAGAAMVAGAIKMQAVRNKVRIIEFSSGKVPSWPPKLSALKRCVNGRLMWIAAVAIRACRSADLIL